MWFAVIETGRGGRRASCSPMRSRAIVARLSLAQVDALGRRRAALGAAVARDRRDARRGDRAGRDRRASRAARRRVGHRFHHPGPITIGGAQDYAEKLRACHVIVDQDEREALIRDGAAKAAAEAGLTLIADEGLVVGECRADRMAGAAARPVRRRFPRRPARGDRADHAHQPEIFRLRGRRRGARAGVRVRRQYRAHDGGAAIVEGNRRVLAARLADARFFWEQDLKVPLEEQAKKLDGIVFHEKLGTVADKVERVAKLARWLVKREHRPKRDPRAGPPRAPSSPRPTSSPAWSANSPNCRA